MKITPPDAGSNIPERGVGTYRESIKSTSLVGGSTAAALIIGLARTKALAVLLGPPGLALFGLYSSATVVISIIAGMGISSSGVRQIAEARSQGDEERIALTARTVQRASFVMGLMGAVALLLLRVRMSQWIFGNEEHAWAIGLLALVVWMGCIQGGLAALIQGNRRIGDVAAQQIIIAIWSVVVTVPIIYVLGEDGVVWAMLASGGAGLATTWWFARRIAIPSVALSWRAMRIETGALLSLGGMFVVSALLTSLVILFTGAFITQQMGLGAMGLYLAAWALSGIYVNTILHAMGTDFYPRLTGVAKDNAQCNQMVNEQAEVSFLVAVPGVIGTIGFAPLVLSVLYSPEFVEAAEILRWLILGILARVIIFPMGYIALAMGKKWCFMGMEAYNHALHVILILMGVWLFGLVGLGVALCVLNIANCWVIRFVAGRLSGFRWSRANLRHWAVLIPPVVIVFLSSMLFDDLTTMLIGAAVAAATGLYCLHTLHRLVGSPAVGRSVRNLLRRLPFAGRATTTTTIKAVK